MYVHWFGIECLYNVQLLVTKLKYEKRNKAELFLMKYHSII